MSQNNQKNRTLYIAIDQEIIAEIFRRSNPNEDIEGIINYQIQFFLDRTDGDAEIWENERYLEECIAEEITREDLERFGSQKKGYRWGPVFMPNGTSIKMIYKKKDFFAAVKHEKIYKSGPIFDLFGLDKDEFMDYLMDDSPCSPSELVKRITRTNRNAWRDLWIRTPGDPRWILADDLRKRFANIR